MNSRPNDYSHQETISIPRMPSNLKLIKIRRSRYWMVSFSIYSSELKRTKMIRKSTKTESKKEAITFAKEFYEDLLELFRAVCRKPTVFLFTDSHVKEESFLEAINNMLTIGIIPTIFSLEENKNEMISAIKPFCKKAGIIETP